MGDIPVIVAIVLIIGVCLTYIVGHTTDAYKWRKYYESHCYNCEKKKAPNGKTKEAEAEVAGK